MSGAPFFTVIGKYKVIAYKVKHSVRMWLFILITRHNKENTKAEALGDAFVENGKERMYGYGRENVRKNTGLFQCNRHFWRERI